MAQGSTYRFPAVSFTAPGPGYMQRDEAQFRHGLEQQFASITAYIERLIKDPISVTTHASTHAAAGSDPVALAWSQMTSGVPDFRTKAQNDTYYDVIGAAAAITLAGLGGITKTQADGWYDVLGAAAAITLAGLGGVPTSRTVNSKALSSNITLDSGDVGAEPALGNPGVDGYALVSTAAGVRSWGWKIGAYQAATVALDTTHYVEVVIGGTPYKLGVVT